MRRRFVAGGAVLFIALILRGHASSPTGEDAVRTTSARTLEAPRGGTPRGDASPPSELRVDRTITSRGCGAYERQLTLSERAEIPPQDHEVVREILEELRARIAAAIPRGPTPDITEVDDAAREGALWDLRKAWLAMPPAQRLRDAAFGAELDAVEAADRDAFAALVDAVGDELANHLWFEVFDTCSVELRS